MTEIPGYSRIVVGLRHHNFATSRHILLLKHVILHIIITVISCYDILRRHHYPYKNLHRLRLLRPGKKFAHSCRSRHRSHFLVRTSFITASPEVLSLLNIKGSPLARKPVQIVAVSSFCLQKFSKLHSRTVSECCVVLAMNVFHMVRSPSSPQQLNTILVPLHFALIIQLERIKIDIRWIRLVSFQYFRIDVFRFFPTSLRG